MLAVRRLIVCVGFCSMVSSSAFGWGPTSTHQALAGKFYEDPLIAGFASEFGTSVSTVVNGAGALDTAGEPNHGLYHSGQWDMVQYRQYIYVPGDSNHTKWYNLDETTRLKYMMHNLGDVSVPIGHSPANQNPDAPSGSVKEAFFEGQAEVGSYGSPTAPTGYYTGTISNIVGQFYNDCMANTDYFAHNVSTGFLTVTPWANANTAAHEGWRISQQLARAVLADYYLAKRNPAEAGLDKTINPGGLAVFDATGLRDTDNVTWNSDGTYHYSSDWTGINQVRWDLNGDGTYDFTGLNLSKTYLELATMFGGIPTTPTTVRIEVLDDEGIYWQDTAALTLTPPHDGDASCDGIVNVSDLGILATNYGRTGITGWSWQYGDFNHDGTVNVSDLGMLATNYGYVGGGEVPEPTTLVLLMGMVLGNFRILNFRRKG